MRIGGLFLIGVLCVGITQNVEAKTVKNSPAVVKKKVEEIKSIEYKDFSFSYDKVEYNTINAPVFSTTSRVIFQSVKKSKKDGRFKNLKNAIANHEKEKPVGWDELVQAVAQESDDLVKLKMANTIINKVPYKDGTDGTYYHPAKLFKKGGVCKDFVMAKYLLLKEAGYPIEKMRVVALTPKTDKPESPFHVVLVAKANNKDYVLDLIPSYLAEQERAKLKTTKEKQIKEIREAGLDIEDFSEKDLLNSKGFYDLDKYVSERGMVWAGNELGAREQFVEPPPKPSKKK